VTVVTQTPQQTALAVQEILAQVERVIIGKSRALETVLLGVLAGGHVLIEDPPGLGKTVLARSFAQVLGLGFTRVQFTPDLLPQDVTGAVVYDQRTSDLAFRPGPIFTNILLADEINRTPPKTQAALLEAMAERQVSADGQTRPLPDPFVVLATDNPIEYEGTYPLPEAQLDRFTVRVRLGYLDAGGEAAMVGTRLDRGSAPPELTEVADAERVRAMVESLEQVEVNRDVIDYIVALVHATREHPKVQLGASPRGTLAVTQTARGAALLAGREFVIPEDVKRVAVPALGHRIVVRPELWVSRVNGDDIVADVLDQVPTPMSR
jgi:MoxR-like ATPase